MVIEGGGFECVCKQFLYVVKTKQNKKMPTVQKDIISEK